MNSKYLILKNPPITEAIINILVKLQSETKPDKLKSITDLISDDYPNGQELIRWEGKIDFKKAELPELTSHERKIEGYFYTSDDKKQVVQIRLDGFSFHRLKPYESWKRFYDEAHRLWLLYKKIASPEMITKVALRYINKLNIPLLPVKDFGDYLTSDPKVPEGLPQTVSSFLTRVVIHESSIPATGIITQTLDRVEVNEGIVPIILDISVLKESSDGIEEKNAWEIMDKLRDFKNDIFFKSITDKTKELFI